MLKKLLNLLSDASVYGLSSMLARIVQFVLLPILTRYLTTADYGTVFMLSILSTLFGPLSNLGMTNALFRRYNLDKDPASRSELFATALASVTIGSVVLMLICMVFAGPLSTMLLGNATGAGYVRVSLLTAAIASVGQVPFVTLRAARRVKTAAAINLAKLLISVSVTLWLVVVLEAGVWGVLFGTLVGETSVLLAQLALTFRSFLAKATWSAWKRMSSYGLPFVPHRIQAAGIELFGIYMVGEMLGLQATGIYGTAVKLAAPVTFVVGAIQASWVPYKFQIHAEDPNPASFFQSSFLYYIAGLSYLWVGVSLWGPDVVRLMTAPEYHAATHLVWAVALIPVSQGIYFMCSTGIELSEDTRTFPLVSLAGLIVVVTGAFALVPLLGALGAALATVSGWITMSSVVFVLSQRRFRIHYDWPTVFMFIALAAAFVVAGMNIQEQSLVLRLGSLTLLSLFYPVVGYLFLLRSRHERERMSLLAARLRTVPALVRGIPKRLRGSGDTAP